MKKVWSVILSFLLGIAHAYSDDIHTMITSEHVEITDFDGSTSFVFIGNVRVTGEDFCLNGDRLEIFLEKTNNIYPQKQPKIEKLRAIGDVHFSQSDRNGRANEIVVLPKEQIMYLIGQAEITDADGTARGDKLFLDKNTRSIRAESRGRSTVMLPQGEYATDALFKPKKDDPNRSDGLEDEE